MKYVQLDEFSLNYRSLKPFAEQLSDFIYSQIMEGNYKAGDKMPTIREAASTLNLGAVTVNNAYKKLIKKDILESHGRQGIYVSDQVVRDVSSAIISNTIAINNLESRYLSLIESAVTFGIEQGISADRLIELTNWIEKKILTEGKEHE